MCSSIRKLNSSLQQKAKLELNEITERVEKDVNSIKEWLKKQAHIAARTDEQWIVTFLRYSNYSIERAKEKIEKYYSMRNLLPDLYKDRDVFDPMMQDILSKGICLILEEEQEKEEKENQCKPTVMIMRLTSFDLNKYAFMDLIKAHEMLIDVYNLDSDTFVINGTVLIVDVAGASASHLSIPLSVLKKVCNDLFQSVPVKIHSIRIINMSSIMEKIINLARPILDSTLMDVVTIYTPDNQHKAFEDIPKNILPKEYGGDSATIEEIAAAIKTNVEARADWLKQDDKYGIDETLKAETFKDKDLYGMDGSFRKLEVD